MLDNLKIVNGKLFNVAINESTTMNESVINGFNEYMYTDYISKMARRCKAILDNTEEDVFKQMESYLAIIEESIGILKSAYADFKMYPCTNIGNELRNYQKFLMLNSGELKRKNLYRLTVDTKQIKMFEERVRSNKIGTLTAKDIKSMAGNQVRVSDLMNDSWAAGWLTKEYGVENILELCLLLVDKNFIERDFINKSYVMNIDNYLQYEERNSPVYDMVDDSIDNHILNNITTLMSLVTVIKEQYNSLMEKPEKLVEVMKYMVSIESILISILVLSVFNLGHGLNVVLKEVCLKRELNNFKNLISDLGA